MSSRKSKKLSAVKLRLPRFFYFSFLSILFLLATLALTTKFLQKGQDIKVSKASFDPANNFFINLNINGLCTNCGHMDKGGNRLFVIDEGDTSKGVLYADIPNGIQSVKNPANWHNVTDNVGVNTTGKGKVAAANNELFWVFYSGKSLIPNGYFFDLFRFQASAGNWSKTRQTFNPDDSNDYTKTATAISNKDQNGYIYVATRWGRSPNYEHRIYRINTGNPSAPAEVAFTSSTPNFPSGVSSISSLVAYQNYLFMLTYINDEYTGGFITTVNTNNFSIFANYEPTTADNKRRVQDISIDTQHQPHRLWIAYTEFLYRFDNLDHGGACWRSLQNIGSPADWTCFKARVINDYGDCPTCFSNIQLISANHSYQNQYYDTAVWLSTDDRDNILETNEGVEFCRRGGTNQDCKLPNDNTWSNSRFITNSFYSINPLSEAVLFATNGNGIKLYDPTPAATNTPIPSPTPTGKPNGSACNGDSECSSKKCGVDSDNDKHLSSTIVKGTCQSYLKDDCDDINVNVYPGSLYWASTPRSNGSFDYNCDKIISKRYNCATNLSSPSCSETKPVGKTGYVGLIADCGVNARVRRCSSWTTSSCSGGIQSKAGLCYSGNDPCPITDAKNVLYFRIIEESLTQQCR